MTVKTGSATYTLANNGAVLIYSAWDGNGNRTSHAWGGLTDGYTTHGSSNRLTAITGPRATTYGYDTNGNTLSGEGATYTYSAFNRLATATKAGVTTTYAINALGQRVHKKAGSGANHWFTYGPGGQMLSEYQSSWTHYVRLPDGTPVARVKGGQLLMIHTDHLGRPEIVTNSAKAVVWRASNYAFDRTVTLDSIGGMNLGFLGQYHDAETELAYNYFRTYNPRTGRYLESDPVGLSGGLNTYAYTSGNPVNRIDPSGLLWYGGHFSITYRAARSSGFGFRDSLRLAWQVMAVDWRQGSQGTTPDATKLHAMASLGQSCPDATKAADDLISGKDPDYANDIAARIHAAQDASAPWHYGQTWDGHITSGHVWNDVFYGDAVGDAAYDATMGILGGGP